MPAVRRPLPALLVVAGALIMLFRPSVPASGQIRIQNPSIPDDEQLVYSVKSGADSWIMRQQCSLHAENGGSWYEFSSRSPEADTLIRLDPVTLFPRSSEVVTHARDSIIRRTTEIVKASFVAKADELIIADDFASLPVILRGFPWESTKAAHLVTLGSGGFGRSFSVDLAVAGKESLTLNGKTYECWKVQIGVGGFLGSIMSSIMGKSLYWFSTDPTHYLVRSEGPTSAPGSPRQVVSCKAERSGDDKPGSWPTAPGRRSRPPGCQRRGDG